MDGQKFVLGGGGGRDAGVGGGHFKKGVAAVHLPFCVMHAS